MGSGQKWWADKYDEWNGLAQQKADETEVTIKLGDLRKFFESLRSGHLELRIQNPSSEFGIEEGLKAMKKVSAFEKKYMDKHAKIESEERKRLEDKGI